jgi:superfamily II DNA or RNA helicase
MFVIERGIWKSKLKWNGKNNESSFISKLLEANFTVISWAFNPITKKNDPIKTLLFENNSFYTGLSSLVKRQIIEMGYDCITEDKFDYKYDSPQNAIERIKTGLTLNLRDYQAEAVVKAVKKPFSMISLPTGTGKSLVMAALLLGDDKSTVVVVDSKTLMYQLADNIRTFTGIECGLVGDSHFYPRRWTVAVIDSLLGQRGEGLVRNTEALYFDEAHKAGAPTYRTVVDAGRNNVVIRRGFSGTAFRNDNRTYLLPALTGPVVVHYTTSQMIDDGWLAVPHIAMPPIANFQSKAIYYQQIYRNCIINNSYRNKICVDAMVGPAKKGYPVVGFFRNVREHLPAIRNLLYSAFPKAKIGVLHGNVLSINRQRVLSEFASGEKIILLASVGTTGEGIDLPGETKVGVNFAGGCSEIAVRQLLGRCLRKPKLKNNEINKEKPFHIWWIDPYDKTHDEMRRQSDIRYDIYNGEPSFVMEEDE